MSPPILSVIEADRVSQARMAKFERYPSSAHLRLDGFYSVIGQMRKVNFFNSDYSDDKALTFATALRYAANAGDAEEFCANYLSALQLYLPESCVIIGSTLTSLSIDPVIVYLPSQTHKFNITPEPPKSVRENFLCLGQMILVLFKNLSPEKYVSYMTNICREMAALVGYPSDINAAILFQPQQASWASSVLGAQFQLKKHVLYHVLATCRYESVAGKLFTYISGILAWTELEPLKFIFDALVVPKSPLLSEPSLAIEVAHVCEAFLEVGKSDYPQYFRILEPPDRQRVLEWSRFPTLIAVAQRILQTTSPTLSNFAFTTNVERARVDELVNRHNATVRIRQGHTLTESHAKFLREFSNVVVRDEA